MSKEERKLKAKVDEYFEKYMCVSFDKFIENWEDLERYSKEQDEILERKENIIKEVKDYIRNNMIMYDNIEAEVEDLLILLDKGE